MKEKNFKDKINTAGFKKHPENINTNGRPPKLIKSINNQLIKAGFAPVSKADLLEAISIIIQLPKKKIEGIAKDELGEYPFYYMVVAKELLGDKSFEAMEKLLDRFSGKATSQIDVQVIDKSEAIQKLKEYRNYLANEMNKPDQKIKGSL